MYVPAHFEESKIEILHDLIIANPLAILVTMSSNGINANHIPLHLIKDKGRYGSLQGHVARANSVWSDIDKDVETLIIFQGPNSYISPSWYPTKQENGKVVPTWNYVTVHAYGKLRVVDDPVWVKSQLELLTNQQEASYDKPWTISDAPVEFTNKMISAVVGIEISISRIIGKWKVSQNQPEVNQTGVVEGLKSLKKPEAMKVATLVENSSKNIR
jgi:transcriptional regulator